MRKILAIATMVLLILMGCGEDSSRGYSSDPNEFPTDLQALENGATIEEATALVDTEPDELLENKEDANDESVVSDIDMESVVETEDVTQDDMIEVSTSDDDPEVIITLVLNTNSMKAHCPDCSSVNDMKPANRKDYTGTVEDVIAMGYKACQRCHPF